MWIVASISQNGDDFFVGPYNTKEEACAYAEWCLNEIKEATLSLGKDFNMTRGSSLDPNDIWIDDDMDGTIRILVRELEDA